MTEATFTIVNMNTLNVRIMLSDDADRGKELDCRYLGQLTDAEHNANKSWLVLYARLIICSVALAVLWLLVRGKPSTHSKVR